MDREIKKIVKKNLELSQRTFREVQKMRRAFMWRRMFTMLKWSIIVILLVVGFLQVQPYIDGLYTIYQDLGDRLGQIKDFPQEVRGLLP